MFSQLMIVASLVGQFPCEVPYWEPPPCVWQSEYQYQYPKQKKYVHYNFKNIPWLYVRQDVVANLSDGRRIIVPVLNHSVPYFSEKIDDSGKKHWYFSYSTDPSRFYNGAGEINYSKGASNPTVQKITPTPKPMIQKVIPKPDPTVKTPVHIKDPPPSPSPEPPKLETHRQPVNATKPEIDVYKKLEDDILPRRGKNWIVPEMPTDNLEKESTKTFPRYGGLENPSKIRSEEQNRTKPFPRY